MAYTFCNFNKQNWNVNNNPSNVIMLYAFDETGRNTSVQGLPKINCPLYGVCFSKIHKNRTLQLPTMCELNIVYVPLTLKQDLCGKNLEPHSPPMFPSAYVPEPDDAHNA